MKFIYILSAVLILTSCASSQNAAITKEAEKKVSELKPLIGLSDTQEAKMVAIETEYLKASKKLTYSPTYYSKLQTLKDSRINQIKEVLTRAQYIKFDLFENKRINKVPIQVN